VTVQERIERTCANPGCHALVLFVLAYRDQLVMHAVCTACGSPQRLLPASAAGPERHWVDEMRG